MVPVQKAKNKEEEEIYATDDICSRESQELIDYYNNNATLKDLGIKEGGIECEDRDKDYLKVLLGILNNLLGGESDDEEEGDDSPKQGQESNLDMKIQWMTGHILID